MFLAVGGGGHALRLGKMFREGGRALEGAQAGDLADRKVGVREPFLDLARAVEPDEVDGRHARQDAHGADQVLLARPKPLGEAGDGRFACRDEDSRYGVHDEGARPREALVDRLEALPPVVADDAPGLEDRDVDLVYGNLLDFCFHSFFSQDNNKNEDSTRLYKNKPNLSGFIPHVCVDKPN